MITALIWLALTVFTGWEMHRHSMFASSMPALAVLAWYAAAVSGLALVVKQIKRRNARRAARFDADKQALIRAATAELARQQHANEGSAIKP